MDVDRWKQSCRTVIPTLADTCRDWLSEQYRSDWSYFCTHVYCRNHLYQWKWYITVPVWLSPHFYRRNCHVWLSPHFYRRNCHVWFYDLIFKAWFSRLIIGSNFLQRLRSGQFRSDTYLFFAWFSCLILSIIFIRNFLRRFSDEIFSNKFQT